MRVVLQRVKGASISIDGAPAQSIGPGLVLLFGVREGDTPDLIPKLAKTCTVYAIDSRGHGKSDRVPTYHYGEMASDISAFIRQLGLEIVVHGVLSLSFRRRPVRAAGLALDPPPIGRLVVLYHIPPDLSPKRRRDRRIRGPALRAHSL